MNVTAVACGPVIEGVVATLKTSGGIGSLLFAIAVPVLLFLYARLTANGAGPTTEQQLRATVVGIVLLLAAAFVIQLVLASRRSR